MAQTDYTDAGNTGVLDLIAAAILEIVYPNVVTLPTQEEAIRMATYDPYDPWGADRPAEEDARLLAEQVVNQSARIRSLENANDILRAGAETSKKTYHPADQAVMDEVLIRRFLDDIQIVGMPRVEYHQYTEDIRNRIEATLCDLLETATRLLGQFYGLPRNGTVPSAVIPKAAPVEDDSDWEGYNRGLE